MQDVRALDKSRDLFALQDTVALYAGHLILSSRPFMPEVELLAFVLLRPFASAVHAWFRQRRICIAPERWVFAANANYHPCLSYTHSDNNFISFIGSIYC